MIKKLSTRNSQPVTGRGFTLIELLVVISIIGVLLGLSIFGLQGARKSARDATRKADLELIRSGIEIYRSDCGVYPTALSSPLVGDGTNCSASNTYISTLPIDPQDSTRTYRYFSDGATYELCASLEQAGSDTCGGSCGTTCNYKTINP